LIEASQLFNSGPPLATFAEGQHQIDGVWSSLRMHPRAASIVLFHLGVGDHRIFVVDFPKDLIMGEGFVPLCKLSMRRLVSC